MCSVRRVESESSFCIARRPLHRTLQEPSGLELWHGIEPTATKPLASAINKIGIQQNIVMLVSKQRAHTTSVCVRTTVGFHLEIAALILVSETRLVGSHVELRQRRG